MAFYHEQVQYSIFQLDLISKYFEYKGTGQHYSDKIMILYKMIKVGH